MKMPKITKIGRSAACILLVLAVFAIYELRLVQWQLIDGEKYEEISLSNRTDSIQIEAARGEILDRNGNVLAGNRSSYNIVYDALEMDYSARNATILQVLDLLEEREEEWRDRLPIVLGADGTYQYASDSDSEIESLKETLSLAEYATAEDCMAELTRQYDCQGYSREDARNVVSVRYSMTRDGFSRTNPYVIAEDVTAETVAVVSERAQEWPGIEARVAVARYYGEDGTLAPHVVGYTGAIRDYQYEEAVENGTAYDSEDNISGYKWTDTRGQAGIEAAFEEELRGQRGEETIYTNAAGEVESTSVTTTPKEGNTVVTTLDSDLQRVANLSLAKNIEGNTDAKDCTRRRRGGAERGGLRRAGLFLLSHFRHEPVPLRQRLCQPVGGGREPAPVQPGPPGRVRPRLRVQAGGGAGRPPGGGHQRGHLGVLPRVLRAGGSEAGLYLRPWQLSERVQRAGPFLQYLFL